MTCTRLDAAPEVVSLLGEQALTALAAGHYGAVSLCVACALPVDLSPVRAPTSTPPRVLASWAGQHATWRVAHYGCAESAVVPLLPDVTALRAALRTHATLDQVADQATLLVTPADPLRVRLRSTDSPRSPLLAAALRMGAQPLTRLAQPLDPLPGWTASLTPDHLHVDSPHGPLASALVHPERRVPDTLRVIVTGMALTSITGQPYEAVRRAMVSGRAAAGLIPVV